MTAEVRKIQALESLEKLEAELSHKTVKQNKRSSLRKEKDPNRPTEARVKGTPFGLFC